MAKTSVVLVLGSVFLAIVIYDAYHKIKSGSREEGGYDSDFEDDDK